MGPGRPISRRAVLRLGAALSTLPAVLAACAEAEPTLSPGLTGQPSPPQNRSLSPTPTPSPTSTPVPSAAMGRTLYRRAALADPASGELRRNVSLFVEGGQIGWIRPADGEEDPGPAEGLVVVDAEGATIVPGMVDGHSHVTGPGGANWLARFGDPPERLLEYAEQNARLAWQAGIRWFRDVGSPRVADPVDGRQRALALGIRDRWEGQPGYPTIRAAGTWLATAGVLVGRSVQVPNADALLDAALGQLDDGADLVKLYLEGPDPTTSPWTPAEVRRVVEAVHERDARITAHALRLGGARVAAAAGVDAIEHGWELDADVVRSMAAEGIFLVSTMTVLRSWASFGHTTSDPQWASARGRTFVAGRLEAASASVRLARDAGVPIAAGTDFGGGSARANQLAWEVESLVEAGLEPAAALFAATGRGGELLGEPDAGVVREGGPADFFLVHGDPLSDPSALWRVWRHA